MFAFIAAAGLMLAGVNAGLAFAGKLARTVKENLGLSRVIETAVLANRGLTVTKLPDIMFDVGLKARFERAGLQVSVQDGDDCGETIYAYHYGTRICLYDDDD